MVTIHAQIIGRYSLRQAVKDRWVFIEAKITKFYTEITLIAFFSIK